MPVIVTVTTTMKTENHPDLNVAILKLYKQDSLEMFDSCKSTSKGLQFSADCPIEATCTDAQLSTARGHGGLEYM